MSEISIDAVEGEELRRLITKRRKLEALDTSGMTKAERMELRRVINMLARMENAEQCFLACERKWNLA